MKQLLLLTSSSGHWTEQICLVEKKKKFPSAENQQPNAADKDASKQLISQLADQPTHKESDGQVLKWFFR